MTGLTPVWDEIPLRCPGEGSGPERLTDRRCEQQPGCKTSQELRPLTHRPACHAAGQGQVLQYLGKGTSAGSVRHGEQGYIKEVDETGSRTFSHPG